jgi:hypothetical protein
MPPGNPNCGKPLEILTPPLEGISLNLFTFPNVSKQN